jgi:hypothetical protein
VHSVDLITLVELPAACYDLDHLWRLILANWPYTLIGVMPTNHRLDAIPNAQADASSRGLIVKWGGLHAVRTALGFAAVGAYLWAALQ